MEVREHTIGNIKIAEIVSDEILIRNAEDGIDLMGSIYYQGFDMLIIHQENITPDFFDLKNKMAGDILQKYSTYRVRLAIVGDYSKFTSKSLKAFMYESNKGKHVNFVTSVDEAFKSFTK